MVAMKEQILVVTANIKVGTYLTHQLLSHLNYATQTAATTANALQAINARTPELIIADLHLPDLSGKDLLVALNSKGMDIPVIVLATDAMEGEILQAFRLGAVDFINLPAQDTEIITTIDRVLKERRVRREHQILAQNLKQTNKLLTDRVQKLTGISNIGKTITVISNTQLLLTRILESAIQISASSSGYLLVRSDNRDTFLLNTSHNLPAPLVKLTNQPWDDGLSSLVGKSGAPLAIHGEPLQKSVLSQVGKAVLLVPIMVKNEVIGIIAILHKDAKPYDSSIQSLLEIIADYAAIVLVNARLFRSLEERSERAPPIRTNTVQSIEKIGIPASIKQNLEKALIDAIEAVVTLSIEENANFSKKQERLLHVAQDQIQNALKTIQSIPSVIVKKF